MKRRLLSLLLAACLLLPLASVTAMAEEKYAEREGEESYRVHEAVYTDAIYTAEDREAIDAGKEVTFTLNVSEPTEKTAEWIEMEEQIGSEILVFLDMTLMKDYDGAQEQQVHKLLAPMEIQLIIWRWMRAWSMDAPYTVWRLHDGQLEALETKTWWNDGMIIAEFETDRFSQYAVTLAQAPAEPDPVQRESDDEDPEEEFWEVVKQRIEQAAKGKTVKATLPSQVERMPWDVMEALRKADEVTLELWRGEEAYLTIASGKASEREALRGYWPFTLLEEMGFAEAQPEENPSTGGALPLALPAVCLPLLSLAPVALLRRHKGTRQ